MSAQAEEERLLENKEDPALKTNLTSEPFFEKIFRVKNSFQTSLLKLDPKFNPYFEVSEDRLEASYEEILPIQDTFQVLRTSKSFCRKEWFSYFEVTVDDFTADE